MNREIHCGNFSSSEIVALTKDGKAKGSFGKPFFTYVEEKNIERRVGRVLKNEFTSKDTAWGHLIEYRVLRYLLGTEYSLISDKTIRHPIIPYWVGSPDAVKNDGTKIVMVSDVKGLGLKAFCKTVDAYKAGGIQAVRENTEDGEKYFWQIVSNSCLLTGGVNKGELILYCPYKSELDEIRRLAINYDGPDPGRFERFQFMTDDEMPYLPDGGYYKNLYHLQFDISFDDKQFIHERVVEAGKFLIESPKLQTV